MYNDETPIDTNPNRYCENCGESGATPETVGEQANGEYIDPIIAETCSDECTDILRKYIREVGTVPVEREQDKRWIDWARQFPNARFWIFWNDSPVKLTLKPGEYLSFGISGHHDEGWYSEGETYIHHGDTVECSWGRDGTDCDGRMATGGELETAVPIVPEFPNPTDPTILYPDWKIAGSFIRDYSAEAMGY